MWCWRRMENISWTDRVRNEEVLHRIKEERNIVRRMRRRKANWIGHILRRNHTEGKIGGGIEAKGRQWRRRKQLLSDCNETRGYWKRKEEGEDRTLWRTRFGRGCELLVAQICLCVHSPTYTEIVHVLRGWAVVDVSNPHNTCETVYVTHAETKTESSDAIVIILPSSVG